MARSLSSSVISTILCLLSVMLTWTLEAVGKCSIASEIGEGEYNISIDYGTGPVDLRKSYLTSLVSALDDAISEQQSKIATLEAEQSGLIAGIDHLIAGLRSVLETFPIDESSAEAARKSLAKATVDLQEKQPPLDEARIDLSIYQSQRSNAQTKLEELNALVLTESKSVWCATYTEGASGDVGTIEINGEPPQTLIVPDAEAYTPDIHGEQRHRMSVRGPTAYINAALLPGWQKWRPTYRVGVINTIDTASDTCSVNLDGALSSAQDLEINQSTSLSDVPIVYMECNAKAFEIGDRVIVEFKNQGWENPQVVGFESNPRPCTQWLYAGVSRRNADGSNQRLTVQIDPETLAVNNSWAVSFSNTFDTTRYGVNRVRCHYDDGRIMDPVAGTVTWFPDYTYSVTTFGSLYPLAISSGHMLKSSPVAGRIFPLYDWTSGGFITDLPDPSVTIFAKGYDNGSRVALSKSHALIASGATLSGFGSGGNASSLVRLSDYVTEWTLAEGTSGSMSSPLATTVTDDYAAILIFNDALDAKTAVIRDLSGSIVRQFGAGSGISGAKGMAIRGDKLFLLFRNITVSSPHNDYSWSISRYNITTGTFEQSSNISAFSMSGGAIAIGDLGSLD